MLVTRQRQRQRQRAHTNRTLVVACTIKRLKRRNTQHKLLLLLLRLRQPRPLRTPTAGDRSEKEQFVHWRSFAPFIGRFECVSLHNTLLLVQCQPAQSSSRSRQRETHQRKRARKWRQRRRQQEVSQALCCALFGSTLMSSQHSPLDSLLLLLKVRCVA